MRSKKVKSLRRAYRRLNTDIKNPTAFSFRALKHAYLRLKDMAPTLRWAKAHA